jgi:hypothetical protein
MYNGESPLFILAIWSHLIIHYALSITTGEACTFPFICIVSYSPLISDLCLREELDDY